MSETITFYKGRREALASSREGHVQKEYDIVSDSVEEDGTRRLVMKERDLSELNEMKEELVDAIAESLGEGGSKTFKQILLDSLGDYKHSDIKRMYRKVISQKKAPLIKATPGCFEIIIGDGRRKNSDIIRIRE